MTVNNYDDDITEDEDAFIKSMIDEYKQKLETATAAGNVKQAWKANMMILVLTQCRSRSSYQEIEDVLRHTTNHFRSFYRSKSAAEGGKAQTMNFKKDFEAPHKMNDDD
jgi:hypothetical protein